MVEAKAPGEQDGDDAAEHHAAKKDTPKKSSGSWFSFVRSNKSTPRRVKRASSRMRRLARNSLTSRKHLQKCLGSMLQ
jgi:hypothetical protein